MIHFLISLVPEPILDKLRGPVGDNVWLQQVFNVFKKVASRQDGVITSGAGQGLRFNCTNGHLAYLRGTVEEEEQELLPTLLGEGDVFYDIGSNIGFFSVIGARLVGRKGRVYAFEPIPRSAEVAAKNARLNSFDQMTVWQVAASSATGEAYMSSKGGHSETYSVSEEGGMQVRRAKVDDLVEERGLRSPDLVKVDTEGHEIEVLKGALETLRKEKPILLVEVHSLGQQFVDFCEETLMPMGYDIAQLDGSPITEKPVRYHILARPTQLTS